MKLTVTRVQPLLSWELSGKASEAVKRLIYRISCPGSGLPSEYANPSTLTDGLGARGVPSAEVPAAFEKAQRLAIGESFEVDLPQSPIELNKS